MTSSPPTSTRCPNTRSHPLGSGVGLFRLPALALVVTLGIGLGGTLAACGRSAAEPDGTPAAQHGSAPPDAGPDGGRVVFFARPQMLASTVLDGLTTGRSAVDVRPVPYTSGETILADLAAGRHADVVEVCSDENARRLAAQGLLQPIDTGRIEAWGELYPVLKRLPGVVVDGKVYMVPVTGTASGIVYDPRRVPATPVSFRDLFAPRFARRMAFRDDAALAFQVAALNLGYDPGTLTAEQITDAEIYLKRHTKKYRSFWRDLDNLAGAFKSGRVVIAAGTGATAEQLRRRGARVAFALAGEGQPLQTCGLAIAAGARDLDAAYALIDYYLEPGTQARIAEHSAELVSNREAVRQVPAAERRRLGLRQLADLDRPVPLVPSLEHLDWIQSWYEVKKGRG